jgi:hypothetical protein
LGHKHDEFLRLILAYRPDGPDRVTAAIVTGMGNRLWVPEQYSNRIIGVGCIRILLLQQVADECLLGVGRNGAPSGSRDGANFGNKFTSVHSPSYLIFRYRPRTLASAGGSVNTRRLESRMGQHAETSVIGVRYRPVDPQRSAKDDA